MSHFAKVIDGKVIKIIVAEQDFFSNFVDDSPGEWIQTSYNTHGNKNLEGNPLRGNYAGIGYSYDKELDAFIPPKPFNSWTLNTNTCLWESPKTMPNDGKIYRWDESILNWVEITQE